MNTIAQTIAIVAVCVADLGAEIEQAREVLAPFCEEYQNLTMAYDDLKEALIALQEVTA